MKILENTAHRPWPLPRSPWIMTQTWHNLLFAHWPIPVDALRDAVPGQLEIDTREGAAWVGVVAFRLSGIRLRCLPEMPFLSHFPEVNVRTYVRLDGKPGVFFMSLDTDNPLTVAIARPWFRLNYYKAGISFSEEQDEIRFHSRRSEPKAAGAEFHASYRSCSLPRAAMPGSLEHWLTERYCYYSVGRGDAIYRCEVHHPAWRLQNVDAQIEGNTMAQSHGVTLPNSEPVFHYAHYMKALIWPVRRVSQSPMRMAPATARA